MHVLDKVWVQSAKDKTSLVQKNIIIFVEFYQNLHIAPPVWKFMKNRRLKCPFLNISYIMKMDCGALVNNSFLLEACSWIDNVLFCVLTRDA